MPLPSEYAAATISWFRKNLTKKSGVASEQTGEVIRSRVLDSISTALQDDLEKSNLLSLPETDIQVALDEIWKCLEVPSMSDDPSGIDSRSSRNKIRRLLLKLVLKYHRLPASFILKGVRCIETESRGSGAFADVYFGALDDQPVALKRLRVYSAVLESEKLKQEQTFYRESILWKNLRHEHIVPFLGISDDVFSGVQRGICMVSPWMVNETIRCFLDDVKQRENLSGRRFVDIVDKLLYQISRGLDYLHTEGIVHGDLHSGNILIDESGNARIADFGMALIADATSYSYASVHGGGAIRWVAPELLAPENFGLTSSRPTPASDVYSFAFICIELYTGEKPFPKLKDHQVMMRVLNGERPPRPTLPDSMMSDEMWSLTDSCWAAQPNKRPSSKQVARELLAATQSRLPEPSNMRGMNAGQGAWRNASSSLHDPSLRPGFHHSDGMQVDDSGGGNNFNMRKLRALPGGSMTDPMPSINMLGTAHNWRKQEPPTRAALRQPQQQHSGHELPHPGPGRHVNGVPGQTGGHGHQTGQRGFFGTPGNGLRNSPTQANMHAATGGTRPRKSKITVEYHPPSKESIREYNDLLAGVNLHATNLNVEDLTGNVTVEYHRPSKESIQEYNDLLTEAHLYAAAAANHYDPFVSSPQKRIDINRSSGRG